MRSIFAPNYVYRPWAEDRRRKARERGGAKAQAVEAEVVETMIYWLRGQEGTSERRVRYLEKLYLESQGWAPMSQERDKVVVDLLGEKVRLRILREVIAKARQARADGVASIKNRVP